MLVILKETNILRVDWDHQMARLQAPNDTSNCLQSQWLSQVFRRWMAYSTQVRRRVAK